MIPTPASKANKKGREWLRLAKFGRLPKQEYVSILGTHWEIQNAMRQYNVTEDWLRKHFTTYYEEDYDENHRPNNIHVHRNRALAKRLLASRR